MLKLRIITASILLPLVLAGILWLPDIYFAIFVAIFACVGSWEWTRFMCSSESAQVSALRWLYVSLVALVLLLSWFYVLGNVSLTGLVLNVAVAWWVVAIILIIVFPGAAWFRKNLVIKGVTGILVLVPAWVAQVSLRNDHIAGVELLLYLLILIAAADTGAYFGGRQWGKHKLAHKVSPGKTWEGVASGMVCVSVVALIYCYSLDLQLQGWANVWVFVGISLATAIFSIAGDLTESLYKREAGLKDSGKILPGHGGVLDRIDSLTAAAPVFLFCLGRFYF